MKNYKLIFFIIIIIQINSQKLTILHLSDIHEEYSKIQLFKDWFEKNFTRNKLKQEKIDYVFLSGDIANIYGDELNDCVKGTQII